MFTGNSKLLEFLEFTHDGSTVPEFIAARAFVEDKVKAVQIKPKRLRSVMQYRRHVLQTPTPQVRGLLTAMAEKAQQAAFDSLAPQRDGSQIRGVRLAVAAEKAYDAPKKKRSYRSGANSCPAELQHTFLWATGRIICPRSARMAASPIGPA